jgi:hypothetical protein
VVHTPAGIRSPHIVFPPGLTTRLMVSGPGGDSLIDSLMTAF